LNIIHNTSNLRDADESDYVFARILSF